MELEYQEAREYIILHGRELLERDKSGKGYVCPCCGSGSGRHGTGMREDRDKPGHFKCWAGGSDDCPNHDNIISIFQKAYHLSNKDAFKECCKRFSIELVHQRDKDQPIPQAVKDLEKIKAKAHAAHRIVLLLAHSSSPFHPVCGTSEYLYQSDALCSWA